MAVLSSMPCPVEGCAVHLRVTGTLIHATDPQTADVLVGVDDAGRAHLASHLLVNNPDLAPEP